MVLVCSGLDAVPVPCAGFAGAVPGAECVPVADFVERFTAVRAGLTLALVTVRALGLFGVALFEVSLFDVV